MTVVRRLVRIVLCADDYAIAPGVSAAIRELVTAGRLSATSCMTATPFWASEGRALAAVSGGIDVGLHLTLTDAAPLGPMPDLAPSGRLPPFGALLRRAYGRRLRGGEIRAELERQLDAFEAVMGRRPDFLDGHHHAHQLPVIRDVVAELCRDRLDAGRAYVRTCAESWRAIARRGVFVGRAVSFAIPGRGLQRALERRGVPSNHGYAGAYDFSARIPYERLFARMLASVRDGTLINCHPGLVDADLAARDSLTTQREAELSFFRGTAFPAILERAGVALGWPRPRTAVPREEARAPE